MCRTDRALAMLALGGPIVAAMATTATAPGTDGAVIRLSEARRR